MPQVAASKVGPFEMKGARQGRVVAETIVATEGVPAPFERVLRGLDAWIAAGCSVGTEIAMA